VEGFFDQIILYSGISLPSLVELLDFLSLLAQITQMSCCVDWVLWRRIFQENNNKKKRSAALGIVPRSSSTMGAPHLTLGVVLCTRFLIVLT
jgi:hypothetical protein